jgi:regulator of sigma E protease
MRIPIIYCEELIFKSAFTGPRGGTDASHSTHGAFWRKALVIFTGPLISFLTAAIILAFLSTAGTSIFLPIIGDVQTGSPAEKAGLEKGDRVISMDLRPVSSWTEMVQIIANSSAKPIRLKIERGTDLLTMIVQPEIRTIQVFGKPQR